MLSLPFNLSWSVILIGTILLYGISRAAQYYQDRRSTSFLPGMVFLASNFSLPGALLPGSDWIPGLIVNWKWRHTMYKASPIDMTSILGVFTGHPVLMTNSPEVSKQILGNKAPFDKFQESVNSFAAFGENVFATMQEDWPRHRKAVAPGFNGRLYASVWNETVNTYYDCMATEKWEKEPEFIMPAVPAVTSKFALYLIAKCGFGIHLAWNEDVSERIKGMSLPECFDVTSRSILFLAFLPHWTYRLPIPALRRLFEAINVLESILQGIIDTRRIAGASNDSESKDIFSLLLAANEREKGSKGALSDRELVSNVFILLLAGHETTSKALAATLGELACHPEYQQRAYDEVVAVIPHGKDPTYDDCDRLQFVQGCFQEGLRMYPPALTTFRRPVEDTILQVPNKQGVSVPLQVPKGQAIAIDVCGIAYNDRVYLDPYTYKPERWLDPATEPLLAFSYGSRVCIGRRFTMVETTAVIALLIRDYKMEPVLQEGQTVEQWLGMGVVRFSSVWSRTGPWFSKDTGSWFGPGSGPVQDRSRTGPGPVLGLLENISIKL
ncbi:cytochrome P450 [Calocera cornea HHB12733]|uniref:Cytochrome P450 n=1 Tax=Calocera cornea HHB12733 TaxID=1353952 RepID=A0A165EY35_9BASI|nr:cytochrome P450 [Calocera cornea HHB12733]